jgi:hypothetical protein
VVVNFISWEGPEANPSFLPEVLSSLEKPGATFVSPFSGIEVSPLEYLSSDPLSPIPPGKCFVTSIVNSSTFGSWLLDSKGLEEYLQDVRYAVHPSDNVYFVVLRDKSEELWKSSSGVSRIKRLFKRKRR